MDKIVPISDLQTKTKQIVETVQKTGMPVIITRRGRPAALVVNYEEYESMLQTLDEMSYPDWQARLSQAEEESRKNQGIFLDALKKKVSQHRERSRGKR